MDTSLTDSQKVSATVAAVDALNSPVSIPSGVVPVWTSGDTSVFTVDASADPSGLSAMVTAVAPGSADLTVTATINSVAITGTSHVTVTADAAGSLVITFGTPQPK